MDIKVGKQAIAEASKKLSNWGRWGKDSKTPLTQYHFGGAQPDPGAGGMNDDYTKNYGINERAEVGLITLLTDASTSPRSEAPTKGR